MRGARRDGSGLRKVLAATLVLIAVAVGYLGAKRMGLLSGRATAVAIAPAKPVEEGAPKDAAAAPAKTDPAVQPAKAAEATKPAAADTKEKGTVQPAAGSESAKGPQPGKTAP